MNFIIVFIGGGLGSLVRYLISGLFPMTNANSFPTATLLSNFLACAVLGITLLILKDKSDVQAWQLFMITGFCGGFSTFSTFSYETIQLIQTHNYIYAGINILAGFISCLLILFIIVKLK